MLKKAKIQVKLRHPFFASTVFKMPYVEDASVGTIGISTKEIRYNPEFIQGLNREEQITVLCHETMHYLLLHHLRCSGKDLDTWNKACDYVVNAWLRRMNFKMPKNHLYDPKYEKMDAEKVYNMIYVKKPDEKGNSSSNSGQGQSDEKDGESQSNSEPQNWGKILPPPKNENVAQAEAKAKQDAAEAMMIGKQAGTLPAGIEEMIAEIVEPKQNWKEVLLKFIAEKARNDYSWIRPNPRYIQQGVYLPALESIELGKVIFGIDTSCSVDEHLLAEFVAEIREASTLFNFPVTVIHCDTKVQKVEELDEDSVIKPIGRGGTAFRPMFDYVNEHFPDTKALVYFTDGECWDKLEEPEYDVLWIIYENKSFKPQFGTVIHINQN